MKKCVKVLAGALAGLMALSFVSCGKKGSKEVTIRYQLWDSAQLPAYQAAADKFTEKHPGIKISIVQLGWDDYWTGLQTEMIGGTAGDVFTDHLAKYMDFASKNQLVDLTPYIKRDNVDTGIYMNDLEKLWQSQDGKT